MDIVDLMGLYRWLRHERGFRPADAAHLPSHIKTSFSATVFTSSSPAWVEYLDSTHDERYDSATNIDIIVASPKVSFVGHDVPSSQLAGHLTQALSELQQAISHKPFVAAQFNESIFGNPWNTSGELKLRVSSMLPCEASREVALGNPPPAKQRQSYCASRWSTR